MIKRSFLTILIWTLLSTLSPYLAFSVQSIQYENQIIDNVNIVFMNGQEQTECDRLLVEAKIKTKSGTLFSHQIFDNDLKTLAADFDRIEPSIHEDNQKIQITLNIWPKPLIHSIEWIGNTRMDTSSLQSELEVEANTIFDRKAFTQAFHKVKTYYVKKGFFEAQLRYEVIPIPESNQVDIQIIIDEGRSGRIREIQFVNFTEKEQDDILEQMLTKEYFPIVSWFNEDGTYREELLQEDEQSIVNYLHNSGFADARVMIDLCQETADSILIRITADKGVMYHVGRVCFSGNSHFSNEQIEQCFVVGKGSPYSPEAIRATVNRITQLYGKYGFIDAIVDYEPRLSDDPYVYDLAFTIEEGDLYRVGIVKVFGNHTTQTRVILNETMLIPGQTFNIERLKLTEARLMNTRYFKNVNVYAVKSDDECSLGSNYRDVHIEVEESCTGSFGAFFGFSTSENLFGGFNLTEMNFNAAGLSALWDGGITSLRGGGEYAHFQATIGAKARSYLLSWNKPYFLDTPWVVGFDLERSSNRYVSKDYDIESIGLKLKGIYELNIFAKIGCHYRLVNSHINLRHQHVDKENNPDWREDLKNQRKLTKEAHESGLISAVGITWLYDSGNHPLCPTSGYKSRIEFECAGVGGRHTFLSFGYINTFYFQTRPWDTLGVWKLRWDLQFLQPYGGTTANTIPIDERLFLGGDTTIRGYRPYRLGPVFNEDEPRGGVSMQLLSIEYAFPIWDRIEGFAFADSGHLSLDTWHFGQFQTAVGYGLRLAIFPNAPPLTIGWGFPLNPKNSSEVKRFFLSMGGQF